jgi:hypothetical protein
VLRASSGGGSQTIDVGYLPTDDAPAKPAGEAVGRNPVPGYYLNPLYSWSINYFPVNFQSTTGNGPIIRQLYFREALQYLINQAAVPDKPEDGRRGPAQGIRAVHGRPGRHLPADRLPERARQRNPHNRS